MAVKDTLDIPAPPDDKQQEQPLNIPPPPAGDTMGEMYKNASLQDPNKAAKVIALSRKLGKDQSEIAANIPQAEAASNAPTESDFVTMRSTHPATYDLLSDRDNMVRLHDDIPNLMATERAAAGMEQANSFLGAIKAGYQQSGTGTLFRAGVPPTVALAKDAPEQYRLASKLAATITDLPLMGIGSAIGGAFGAITLGAAGMATGNPYMAIGLGGLGFAGGSSAGMFMAPAAVREAAIQYHKGTIKDFGDLMQRLKAIAIPSGKQGLVGIATGLSGGAAKFLGAGELMAAGAELTGMTAAGSAVEGERPQARDFLENLVLLGGLKAGGAAFDKVSELAKGSKFRERAPGEYEAHVDKLMPPVWIDPSKFESHFGDKTPEMIQKLDLADAYNAAKQDGTPMQISAGKWFGKEMDSHREGMKDDIKTDPESFSASEIKEAQDQTSSKSAPGQTRPLSSQGDPASDRSSPAPYNTSVDPKIENVKERTDDWLGREAKARGMTNDDNFVLQYATHVHDEINELQGQLGDAMKAATDKKAFLEQEYTNHPAYLKAKEIEQKFGDLQQAYPDIVSKVPSSREPGYKEALAKIMKGFNDLPEKKPRAFPKVPPPDPTSANLRVIEHGSTRIDEAKSSGDPPISKEDAAKGILDVTQIHTGKFADEPLSDKGRAEVEELSKRMKGQNFSKIVSSPAKRTMDTAKALGNAAEDPRLAGLDVPEKYGGMPVEEFKPIFQKAVDEWAQNADAKPFGQSFNEWQGKVIDAVRDHLQGAQPGNNIALVANSWTVKLMHLLAENGGRPIEGDMIRRMMEAFDVQNTEVHPYKFDNLSGLQKVTETNEPAPFLSHVLTTDGTPTELGGMEKIKPFQLPEMVKLVKTLTEKFPGVTTRFKNKYGAFYPGGEGFIRLRADIFKDNAEQAVKTLAHEIGHLADYIPDHTMARGNLLGRILSLNKFLKQTFGGELFPPEGTDQKPIAGYEGKFNEELGNELKGLSAYWRPWDENTATPNYRKYRNSSEELYADGISVLLNSPETLQKMAPKFYDAFFANLDRKPQFKEQFVGLQELLNGTPDDLLEARQKDVRAMYTRSEDIYRTKAAEAEMRSKRLWERLRQEYDDYNYPILKKIQELEATGQKIPAELNPRYKLQEMSMADNTNYLQMHRIEQEVMDPLRKLGLTYDDVGDYLLFNRILNDRSEFANPLGHTPATAKAQLEYMQKSMGSDKFQELSDRVKNLHDIVFDSVQKGVEQGVINLDTFKNTVEPNKYTYAPFAVLDHLERDGHIGGTVKQQRGTLKEIANPFTSLLMKTMALNRLNATQEAKNSFINFWKENFPEEIAPTKEVRTGPKSSFWKPEPGTGQLKVMENGRLKSYDVDPFIAEAFDRHNAGTLNAAAYIMRQLNNGIFRPLFIDLNPGFVFYKSPVRYFERTWKLNPNATLKTAMVEYLKAIPEAARYARGNPSDLVQEMINNKSLDVGFGDYDFALTDSQYARTLKRLGVKVDAPAIPEPEPGTPLAKGIQKTFAPLAPIADATKTIFAKALSPLLEGMRFSAETLTNAHKIASYKIRVGAGESGEELSYNVRNYAGLPNSRVRGLNTDTTNAFWLFSNILKEHYKTSGQIAAGPSTAGGYWAKTAINDIFPKMLMLTAASGAFGASKELKKAFDGMSEYDKTNYLCIPLGFDQGKTVYARIPGDDLGRLVQGMVWKIGNAVRSEPHGGIQDVMNMASGMTPSVAPPIQIGMQWGLFLSGVPPYDLFRGQPIIPRKVMDGGGWPALKRMVQWTTNEMGLTSFSTHDTSRQTRTETTLQMTPILKDILKVSDYGQEERARYMRTH